MSECQHLALAVIAQAFNDAHRKGQYSTELDHDHARAFLLERSGAWAVSRALWAMHAGLDPDYLRDRALETLPATPLPVTT